MWPQEPFLRGKLMVQHLVTRVWVAMELFSIPLLPLESSFQLCLMTDLVHGRQYMSILWCLFWAHCLAHFSMSKAIKECRNFSIHTNLEKPRALNKTSKCVISLPHSMFQSLTSSSRQNRPVVSQIGDVILTSKFLLWIKTLSLQSQIDSSILRSGRLSLSLVRSTAIVATLTFEVISQNTST